MRRTLITLIFVVNTPLTIFAADKKPAGIDLFETKIRPVLVKSCYQCHSAKAQQAKKLKGGLLLDTRAGIRKGGESGPAVVPGKVVDSLLINAIRHQDLKMPPKGKLPDNVIADFVKWVELGAPDPRDGKTQVTKGPSIDIEAGKKFWSFQPIGKFDPPTTKNTTWSRTAVDRFILAKQETQGIIPGPTVGRSKLIRRAYYDLVGLPPTAAEVEQFAGDTSSGAYEKLIDRLLQSEHYGERWARHWLDLVRFAESNGYAFDKDRPAAYHYRDFVIKALNSDMPYDQFVRWQIAGDLLAPDQQEAIAATGFLVAGPFTTQQTQKERERSRYEQLDDMLVTMGTSMLGLTVGCARCHDHKYDPIPQHDYYRLVSGMAEVGFTDFNYDPDPAATQAAKAAFDKVHQPLVAAQAKFEKEQLPGRLQKWAAALPPTPELPTLSPWQWVGPFAGISFDKAFGDAYAPEKKLDLTQTFQDGKLKWTPKPEWKDGTVHNTLTGDNSANYLYRTIDSKLTGPAEISLGRDDAIKVFLNGKQVYAKKAPGAAAPDQDKVTLQLKAGKNALLLKVVNASGPSGFYFKLTSGGPPANIVAILKVAEDKRNAKQKTDLSNYYRALDPEWTKLNTAVQDSLKKQPKPKFVKIYSAKTRGSTYNFGADNYKVYFLTRGNVTQKQGLATPGYIQVLMSAADQEKHWTLEPTAVGAPPKPRAPRIALADWIADTDQGAGQLLARVIVNRLWQHHMGRGLVATPSDFGARGERPTHPELLDWLAAELIKGGWKLKPIHKLIMTSAVYLQSGEPNAANQKTDPDNNLWWRRPSQRLEAEIIRDALLAVSGSLDRKLFGPSTRQDQTPRRSIYLTVKRSELIPILQLFDAPDAMQGIGKRETTTVPAQALAMMNSAFVRDMATKFSKRILPGKDGSVEKSVSAAYLNALSRKPNDTELKNMVAFVKGQAATYGNNPNATNMALADCCHVLMCLNEFVYVD